MDKTIKELLEKDIQIMINSGCSKFSLDAIKLEIPMDIKGEQWMETTCPNCGKTLSTGGYDGYYTLKKIPYCPECRQVFNWIN